MSGAIQARQVIREALIRAGGVYRVSEAAGLHFTQVYAFLRGGRLREDNAGKLRAQLPEVPAEVWADIAAPVDPEQAEAGA